MSRVNTGWVRYALVSLSLAAAATLFSADARAQGNADDVFRRGLEAYRKGQWPQAAALMAEAIKVRPQESKDTVGGFLGIRGDQYLPHFYLGGALFQLNNCAAAMREWAISRQHGAIAGEQLKQLEQGNAECERRLKFDQDSKRTRQRYDDVNGIAGRIASLAESNLDVWRAEAESRAQYERAREELNTAAERIKTADATRGSADLQLASAAIDRANAILVTLRTSFENAVDSRRTAQSLMQEVQGIIAAADKLDNTIAGKKVPFTPAMTTAHQQGRTAVGDARRLVGGASAPAVPTLQSARTLALNARDGFEKLLVEIEGIEKGARLRQVSDEYSRANETLSFLDSDLTTLAERSAKRPGVLAEDQVTAVLQEVPRLRRRLEGARKSEDLPGIAGAARRASELREQVTGWIAAFGPLTLRDRGLHEVLERGAQLFLEGQYQQAASALEQGEAFGDDVPLRLHVHLFRAASLYQLFVRSGESDQGLRAQAVQEVEHSKGIDSAFQPDARAFSPKFIGFYRSVVVASGPAAPEAPAPAAPAPAVPVPVVPAPAAAPVP
jgi:hypothetical protein